MDIIYTIPVTTLASSNVSESAYSEWQLASSYSEGDKVYVTEEAWGGDEVTPHKIFESLQDDNQYRYPPDWPEYWQDQGGTNRWAMFDEYLDSQTSNATSIEVEIAADNADRAYLFYLESGQKRQVSNNRLLRLGHNNKIIKTNKEPKSKNCQDNSPRLLIIKC